MDATVNDFLNEINQIVPLDKKNGCAWQECFDDNTGYSYYWNVNTDEVTWEMPVDYKKWLESKGKGAVRPSNHVCAPSKPAPLFPTTSLSSVKADSVKIYKIENEPDKVMKRNECDDIVNSKAKKSIVSKQVKSSSDSEDEKIVLISSYGGETDSEDEKEELKLSTNKLEPGNLVKASSSKSTSPILQTCSSDDVNDEEILSQIQNRAKILQKLGGELPPDVQKLVEPNKQKESKGISGFSLLAAYGDSDDDDDEEENNDNSPNPAISTVTSVESKISHSILFPIAEPIDVKQFSEQPKTEKNDITENSQIDHKAFQRKRRIGIDLVNTRKRVKNESSDSPIPNETAGLGFKTSSEYPGFKSGGIMFVKSDVLNPSNGDKDDSFVKDNDSDVKNIDMKAIEKTMTTLSEKLKFLSEGRGAVLPVQVMIIQLETLDTALKAGGLSAKYLQKYLNETCSDLVKLEKEATPQGWLLQWDRLNKRYYYRNEATGESQWEYPQADIVGGDDAMDISMTPPREDNEDSQDSVSSPVVTPPPPPKIKDPLPPPAPKISNCKGKASKRKETEPPLPPPEVNPPLPPLPPENVDDGSEPLPPGVDVPDVVLFASQNGSKENSSVPTNDSLNTALSSFYSDLAAIESNSPAASTVQIEESVNLPSPSSTVPPGSEKVKKKKKTKVKLAQGLAMKKKGVSKLVEKWKNVQKNYI